MPRQAPAGANLASRGLRLSQGNSRSVKNRVKRAIPLSKGGEGEAVRGLSCETGKLQLSTSHLNWRPYLPSAFWPRQTTPAPFGAAPFSKGDWRLDVLRPTRGRRIKCPREMRPKLTFRWQKVNETCASSSIVSIAPGWRDLRGEVGPASRAGHLQECPISRPPFLRGNICLTRCSEPYTG